MNRARTLRRRVVVAMVAFTAAVCLAYGALAFLFVYAVEDELFAALLDGEAAHVAREVAAGRDARPRLPFVHLHRSWSDVPAEVRTGASPRGREVAGADGRHYHLRHVTLPSGDAWLVAEVSSILVVRPMRATLLSILLPATAAVLLCSSLIAALVARRSVRQLSDLVEAVQQNNVALVETVGGDVADHEVQVLAQALDDAFGRVHALLQREKAFVGDVSHELRTPIAVIRGAAELLERRELDAAARAQVRRIRDAARSGEEIIELLLALAREETAREARAPIALLALIEKLVLRHRELLGDTEADIRIDVSPQLRLLAPPAAAEVIIANLITNALRHGGGTIVIAAGDQSLTVRDRGAGFSPDGSGRGLGLSLVRRLCDVCGLRLTLESSDAGTAATVWFGEAVR